NSPRMSRFLRFVVERTIDGSAAEIKEYVVAIEVFDKPPSYDPQADSTVRTEASKLRTRLARYYETHGRDDSVLISIPKGAYVPVFDEQKSGVAPAAPHRTWLWGSLAAAAGLFTLIIGAYIWYPRRAHSTIPSWSH